jgi:hypothetical protein
MLDGTAVPGTIVVPEVDPALGLKPRGWSSRSAATDAVDVWRRVRILPGTRLILEAPRANQAA